MALGVQYRKDHYESGGSGGCTGLVMVEALGDKSETSFLPMSCVRSLITLRLFMLCVVVVLAVQLLDTLLHHF